MAEGAIRDLPCRSEAEKDRIIFHVDVNSAFLSWSAVKRLKEDPEALDIRTVPAVICGDVESRHGIVTAKSIPAKAYGIETAEPVVSALRKCPDLLLVKGDRATYKAYSEAFIRILARYSPVIQQVSIDEAYLDMTGTYELYRHLESPEDPFPICLARAIKDEIREELGFTVNVGISCNKLLAKMASDFKKPDRIHTLYPEEVPGKMWPLPIGNLYGCGRQTADRLTRLGIRTIGDAARMDCQILQSQLGEKAGAYIWRASRGISNSQVKTEREEVKSVSNETTLPNDIDRLNYYVEAYPVIRSLSDQVAKRLRKKGFFGSTISVSVKTADFKRLSRQTGLAESTDSPELIYQTAIKLLDELCLGSKETRTAADHLVQQGNRDYRNKEYENKKYGNKEYGNKEYGNKEYGNKEHGREGLFYRGGRIRLLGVGVSNLDHGEYRQMNLFDLMETRKKTANEDKLNAALDAIRSRFGEDSIVRGSKLLK